MALFTARLLAHTSIRPDAGRRPPQADAEAGLGVGVSGVGADTLIYREGTPPWPDGEGPRIDTPLPPPDPASRPPREIDWYRHKFDPKEEWLLPFSTDTIRVSSPFSMQIGDWYWTQPPGHSSRDLRVITEFRSGGSYNEKHWQYMHIYICSEIDPETGVGEYSATKVLRVGPGLFRLEPTYLALPLGACDISSLPAPAGGYTQEYPCGSPSPAVIERFNLKCG